MGALRAIAFFFLFIELPVPIYWLIIHPLNSHWKNHVRAAFWFAGLASWTVGGTLLWMNRARLLAVAPPQAALLALGFALIGIELYLFWRVEHELGGRRLVGLAELTGTGELHTAGLYGFIRHPRYAGMFCGVTASALIAGTPSLWVVVAVWAALVLLMIGFEDRELTARFGPAYSDYRKRVPALLPRMRPGPR